MPASTMTRDEAIVEITRRILAECEPVRIYLFGSTARGEAGPDSDLDFLVVLRDDAPRDLVQGNRLDRALWGVPWAADVVPWRVSDFEGRAAHVVASLPAVVSREGKLLKGLSDLKSGDNRSGGHDIHRR